MEKIRCLSGSMVTKQKLLYQFEIFLDIEGYP